MRRYGYRNYEDYREREKTACRRGWNDPADRFGRRTIEVLYIHALERRLLSVEKMAECGLKVELKKASYTIWGAARAIALGKKVSKAYVLNYQHEAARLVLYVGADNEWELWHARMGYPGRDRMIGALQAKNRVPRMTQGTNKLRGGCLRGKQTVTPFPSRSEK